MFSDKLWITAVVVALSSLLILTFFMLYPITNKDGTVEQTKVGLDKAINKFDAVREEARRDSILTPINMSP